MKYYKEIYKVNTDVGVEGWGQGMWNRTRPTFYLHTL
jgi:hypothetical protein